MLNGRLRKALRANKSADTEYQLTYQTLLYTILSIFSKIIYISKINQTHFCNSRIYPTSNKTLGGHRPLIEIGAQIDIIFTDIEI